MKACSALGSRLVSLKSNQRRNLQQEIAGHENDILKGLKLLWLVHPEKGWVVPLPLNYSGKLLLLFITLLLVYPAGLARSRNHSFRTKRR